MLKTNLFSLTIAILLFSNTFLQSQTNSPIKTAVYFETASADLSVKAKQALTQLVGQIQQFPDYRIDIAAHTDERGTMEYNNQLAEERAQTVEAFLKTKSITTDQFAVKAYGETQQTHNNEQESTRRFNRRVDIIVEPLVWTSTEDIVNALQASTQNHFTIAANAKTKLVGKKGTILWISPNSFEFSAGGGTPSGPIEITFTEALSYDDMIANNLFTSSKGKLLETGGMVKIEAKAANQTLKLKSGRNIKIGVPTPEFDERMNIFMGTGHDMADAPTDWNITNQKPASKLEPSLNFAPKPPTPAREVVKWEFEADYADNLPRAPKSFSNRMPEAPFKESIRYKPPFFQRLLMSKKKKAAKIETLYQQKVASYERRLKRYSRQLAKHKQQVAKYETAKALAAANKEKARLAFYEQPEIKAQQAKFDAVYETALLGHAKKMEEWQSYRDKKIADYEASFEQKGGMNMVDMSRYIFTVNTLGWVNVDVFYKEEGPKGALQLATVTDKNLYAFVLFKSIKSVVQLRPNTEGQYFANNLPIGSTVEVLAIKVEAGKALVAHMETEVKEHQVLDLAFEPTRLKDIREYMTALD